MSEPVYAVEIQCPPAYTVDAGRLREAVGLVLRQHDREPGSGVTVQITDDESVRGLNRDFRGVDAPTDVLSFPADMPPLPDDAADMMPDEERLYVGDLAVAYPYTAAQAARLGHDLAGTLALLVVHGTLHLLGYDHDTPANRAEMWAAQARALTALGVPLEIVPALEDNDA
jgi:probable rRNA maturation factor